MRLRGVINCCHAIGYQPRSLNMLRNSKMHTFQWAFKPSGACLTVQFFGGDPRSRQPELMFVLEIGSDFAHETVHLLLYLAYDANSLRRLLAGQGAKAVIPSTTSRNRPIPYNKALYRQRNLIERMFARLKDFRRVATRYDKLARNFRLAQSSPQP
jgi:transposase